MALSLKDFLQSTAFNKDVQEMVELTQPLKQIGVEYFSRVELLPNGLCSCLINNDKWPWYYTKHRFFDVDPLTFSQQNVVPGLYLINPEPFGQQSKLYRLFMQLGKEVNHVNLSGCFTYTISGGKRVIYNWGSSSPFFRHYEWVEAFIHYFDEKAQTLIKKTPRTIFLPSHITLEKIDSFLTFIPNNVQMKNGLEMASSEFDLIKYHSIALGQKYNLTVRETQCLCFLLKGKLVKQIAAELGISARTAEAYVNTLKDKLRCRTKSEIILKVMTQP